MYNVTLQFTYPWLLLLLIPALALALVPYFRQPKKYRRNRNKVISLVLHCVLVVSAVFLLSGVTLAYTVKNDENEILLLVDVSRSEELSETKRDQAVKTVLDDSRYDGYKVGVVTFGYDHVYAVPLTKDVSSIYDRYLAAERPDDSATDIASALLYAKDLFTQPETAKIVLISDGIETDGSALSAIRAVSVGGVKVDVANVSVQTALPDARISAIELPDYHVSAGEECTVGVQIQSSSAVAAEVSLTDNGVPIGETRAVQLAVGAQTVSFTQSFGEGLHALSARIRLSGSDLFAENNDYCTYLYLDEYNDVLVVEYFSGDSDNLVALLEAGGKNVRLLTLSEEELPEDIDQLRAYDEIVLNNVARKDMTEDFERLLYAYVHDYGGGLFTVGGNDGADAHAYNVKDMENSVYQQILPVQATNYTPPIGVVIVIDNSGSMGVDDANLRQRLYWAKEGAKSCLNALTNGGDYVGIMTLNADYDEVLAMTPRSEENKILAAIDNVKASPNGSSTIFSAAIEHASEALINQKNVSKRHVILVTDGGITPGDKTKTENFAALYNASGITLSIVAVDMDESRVDEYAELENIVTLGGGTLHRAVSGGSLVSEMRRDLEAAKVQTINYAEFQPIVARLGSSLLNGVDRVLDENADEHIDATLSGFYGVRAKEGSEVVLVGDYDVPIYAQWKFGKGAVGSFMCDLKGTVDSWSQAFLASDGGKRFIQNVADALTPTENIKPTAIRPELTEDNYTNTLNVYAALEDGETIRGKIVKKTETGEETVSLNALSDGSFAAVTVALNSVNQYSRCSFSLKEAGVFTLVLEKTDAEGNVRENTTTELYKSFAHSREFDTYLTGVEEGAALLAEVAEKGGGAVIADLDDPAEVFDGFVTELARTYDPRLPLAITIIVLFLLDLVVRKFKFKWIHELIRERREKLVR